MPHRVRHRIDDERRPEDASGTLGLEEQAPGGRERLGSHVLPLDVHVGRLVALRPRRSESLRGAEALRDLACKVASRELLPLSGKNEKEAADASNPNRPPPGPPHRRARALARGRLRATPRAQG
jgi:hypothetical protein